MSDLRQGENMINGVDVRSSVDQILALERAALDRWGKGDPGGFSTICECVEFVPPTPWKQRRGQVVDESSRPLASPWM